MDRQVYALFVDIMGVQERQLRDEAEGALTAAVMPPDLGVFHNDIARVTENELIQLARRASYNWQNRPGDELEAFIGSLLNWPARFIAEFSDAAFIVFNTFAAAAATGVLLMRSAAWLGYPLRGGIGYGSFIHDTSGVKSSHEGQVWSTNSFSGTAVVTAYQAERSTALGMRLFLHSRVSAELIGPLMPSTIPLHDSEQDSTSNRELRLWSAAE